MVQLRLVIGAEDYRAEAREVEPGGESPKAIQRQLGQPPDLPNDS